MEEVQAITCNNSSCSNPYSARTTTQRTSAPFVIPRSLFICSTNIIIAFIMLLLFDKRVCRSRTTCSIWDDLTTSHYNLCPPFKSSVFFPSLLLFCVRALYKSSRAKVFNSVMLERSRMSQAANRNHSMYLLYFEMRPQWMVTNRGLMSLR